MSNGENAEREYERETLQRRNSAHLFIPRLVRVVAMVLVMGTVVTSASPDPHWTDSHPQSFTDLHLRVCVSVETRC